MKRGDIVVCPITSYIAAAPLFRLSLEPTTQNGIKQPSQIMIDKISAIKSGKITKKIGRLQKSEIDFLDHAIKLWLHL